MLKGKTILITGSSRGIGAATARLAKDYRADVILHGKTESTRLTEFASELAARYIFCDVKDEHEVAAQVRQLGRIDILVNSAGINLSKPYTEQTAQQWRDTYDTNVIGTVNFVKALMPAMRERRYGRIVNVSSAKAFPQVQGSWAYASSKAAVHSLTYNMAREGAPSVLVNCVAPGFTDTELTEQTMSPRIRAQIESIPLRRMAHSAEIAEVILFLSSDRASYITGAVLPVDGGFILR